MAITAFITIDGKITEVPVEIAKEIKLNPRIEGLLIPYQNKPEKSYNTQITYEK